MKIEIRGDNVNVPEHTRETIEKRCRFALGRLAGEVGDVRIVVRDVNGPKRGVDIECSIGIRLRRGAEVRSEASHALVQRAAEHALDRGARAAHRLIARRHQFRRDSVRTDVPEADLPEAG
jgi:ribosomal subunit interface protein